MCDIAQASRDYVNYSDPFGLCPTCFGPLALAGVGASEELVPGPGTVVGTATIAAAGLWSVYEGLKAVGSYLESRRGNMRPDPAAEGAHTTIVTGGPGGRVKKYQEWVPNEPRDPRDPRRFKEGKRFDKFGPAHENPDGTKVETPHINEPDGTARPPRPDETPIP